MDLSDLSISLVVNCFRDATADFRIYLKHPHIITCKYPLIITYKKAGYIFILKKYSKAFTEKTYVVGVDVVISLGKR